MSIPAVIWSDAERQRAFETWFHTLAPQFGLDVASLRMASADASFRRYLRVDAVAAPGLSFIIMDAPPALENSQPFVQVAKLMAEAGLKVPQILHWNEQHGFLLLDDLGQHTLLECIAAQTGQSSGLIERAAPTAEIYAYFLQAIDALVAWQLASRPGVLPLYDAALLRRELQLYPDWYVAQHRAMVLSPQQQATLSESFELIIAHNLAAPQVYVHRDFMPRNLMVPSTTSQPLGVLDFQDAVYGPITYDIATLMRDAFLSWEEEVVIDITVRYWEKARQAGLLDYQDWATDFGAFYRSVEWMGLQRHLKVAGIFARLTLRDGKPKYLADTPRFAHYIRHTTSRYAPLKPLLRLLDQIEDTELTQAVSFGRL